MALLLAFNFNRPFQTCEKYFIFKGVKLQIASLEVFLVILFFEGASSDGQSGIFVNSAVLPLLRWS